jgi:2-polyprenyl-3-methyl-5-hydroxy-6-metoxy-1,4-benzoquinol methylase
LPSQKELSFIYNEKTFNGENSTINFDTYLKKKNKPTKEFIQVLKIAEKYSSKGKLLDIGCAAGFFLKYARENGWNVEGVEFSKELSNYARIKLKLTVHIGALSTMNLRPASFDVITLIGVIEHLDNPRSVVDEITKILKPGGILIILTENVGSFLPKVLKSAWNGYMPPEHLSYFSKKSILELIHHKGLKLVDDYAIGSDLRASFGGILGSSRFKNTMKQSLDSDKKSAFTKVFHILESLYELSCFHDRMICVCKKVV